jgi:adenylyltransferase/sulfurtransferase
MGRQHERYLRQIVIPQIGAAGQERLARARVLIVGAGGLGSAAALYLAAAGVGTLGVADPDVVELSNLQRQVLHRVSHLGRAKTASAAETLRGLNPEVAVVEHPERLTAQNAEAILAGYELALDGSDNFATRYLLNDACVLAGKPMVHAAVAGLGGQAMTVLPGQGPCYRCLHPAPPQGALADPARAGILGAVAGLFGTIEATEAIKCLLGIGEPLVGRVLLVDGLDMVVRTVRAKRDPHCAVCGEAPTIRRLTDWDY